MRDYVDRRVASPKRHMLPHLPGVPHLHVNRPLDCAVIEIFHITPTRATVVQKSTKYVKYAVCFPMGNLSFICGTHE